MLLDLRAAARALGGEVAGNQVLAPGPGHSARDRSMAVRPNRAGTNGFVVFSHCGDDFKLCRDHVTRLLGLDRDAWRKPSRDPPQRAKAWTIAQEAQGEGDAFVSRDRALGLWRRRQLILEGCAAWRYLREPRRYARPIPATLGCLPARGAHSPCLIAAIGLADEPEPGDLAIADNAVRAVHLTKLKADGSGKAGTDVGKLTIGQGSLGTPIVLAPPNDGLGLAITEGIEDGLSVHEATGLGAWAAGSAGRMPALAEAVPDYIECVSIFGHRDPAGERGARELAARLVERGIETILKFLEAERAT